MSSGRVHKKVNTWVWGIVTVIMAVAYLAGYFAFDDNVNGLWWILWVNVGILFGFLFGPDLDLPGLNLQEYDMAVAASKSLNWISPKSKQFARKTLNLFLYTIKLWWMPYALLIPHRSPFSHLPGLSDVIRLIYFIFSLAFIASVCYTFIVCMFFLPNVERLITQMVELNQWLFWMVFSLDYLWEKVAIIIGSSIMTFSHLMMDGFKMYW